ncbi:hypothetical protein Psesu_2189 [Pseudoxanthomonas suwonensis 11-1]|uniref:Uncharacterized protein n=2 Tax=Pseudoxanthomonas suwonensis TaxID=314722 RepID=E6WV25_PSEUU|nr:hypothetical protein Psesu_2189 [Pseudoxanthomonas suwonensis 11-1]
MPGNAVRNWTLTPVLLPASRAANGGGGSLRQTEFAAMYLIQLFLPLRDNEGVAFPKAMYDQVRADLAEHFGGVTAFVRSPAVGLWEDDDGDVQRDDVVLLEVMADHVDHGWWAAYRKRLEQEFRQDEVLVRATRAERL